MQPGKLAAWGLLNIIGPGPLVRIEDQLTKRHFLADMMANFSIFPHHSTEVPAGSPLFGPAGKLVPCCWGEKSLVVFHQLAVWVGFPLRCWFLPHHWSRFSLSLQVISRLVDAQHCETITTVPSLATAALDSVLCHRPLRLSHWPLLLHQQPLHSKTCGLYVPLQNACSQCSVDAPTNCGGSKSPAMRSIMGQSIASGDVGGSLGGIP